MGIEIFSEIIDLMKSEDFADSVAKMYKNIYDALRKERFNKKDSLNIVKSMKASN